VKSILVTGGAGFIGSHLVDELVTMGHRVRILDNLDPQVHGDEQKIPDYINKDAEFIFGDVLSKDSLKGALKGIEVVYHLAAAVGVGQSMYEIYHYTKENSLGGANLLDVIVNEKIALQKMIVASSMSIYGEGKYLCRECGILAPRLRPIKQMKDNTWEMMCPECGKEAKPLPTDESKPLNPTSVYAITKRDHEEMFLSVGQAYDIPVSATRFFNVYGTRQSLSNPYTGVCAIFASRILNGKNPLIFEDGLQTRDFIHVKDIVQALVLCMEKEEADYECFNVGTGMGISIKDIAERLINFFGKQDTVRAETVGKFRAGDIRHCFADISKINSFLGFSTKVSFEKGLEDLFDWAQEQNPEDQLDKALSELSNRGLTY